MVETFRGEVNQKVDGKARVSIPAAFRRVLEAGDPACPENKCAKVIMVYGDERRQFVECYSIFEMRRVETLIARLPKGSPRRRFLELNLITLSATVEIDGDGRIVLPQKVREKIGLGSQDLAAGAEITFAGALETFHIWKSETYESVVKTQSGADFEELEGGLDMLVLLPGPEA